MTSEKLKRSLRRFHRRTASLRRRMVAAIQERSRRQDDADWVHGRVSMRGSARLTGERRRPTRQELQHYADWQQSRSDMGVS
jgi:hypothetical protein